MQLTLDMSITKTGRYEELDALRGLAALLVVFFHFTLRFPQYNRFFLLGTTGVDLFFMISGFVIFMSLQKIEKSQDFIINRVSRLYPTYWTAVTFTAILLLLTSIHIHNTHDLLSFLRLYAGNMTMFQYYLGMGDIDGPYWTMIIEMLFYIVILIMYRFNLLSLLKAVGVGCCFASLLLFRHRHHLFTHILENFPLAQFIPLFFSGIIFYKIYTEKAGTFGTVLNYMIIVLCLYTQLTLFPIAGRSSMFISFDDYRIMLVSYFILFTVFVNNGLKFIINRVTIFLGKISFALYLTHQYFCQSIIIPFLTEKLHVNFWISIVFIALPIAIGIATFITYYIEIPYGKKMKAKLHSLTRRQKLTLAK